MFNAAALCLQAWVEVVPHQHQIVNWLRSLVAVRLIFTFLPPLFTHLPACRWVSLTKYLRAGGFRLAVVAHGNGSDAHCTYDGHSTPTIEDQPCSPYSERKIDSLKGIFRGYMRRESARWSGWTNFWVLRLLLVGKKGREIMDSAYQSRRASQYRYVIRRPVFLHSN